MRRKSKKQLTKSNWYLILFACIVAFLLFTFVREYIRTQKINQEIAELQSSIENLETEKNELADYVEYIKTERYLEEQLRLKLGKALPGEKTIVLNDFSEDDEQFKNIDPKKINYIDESNIKLWWKYFFSI